MHEKIKNEKGNVIIFHCRCTFVESKNLSSTWKRFNNLFTYNTIATDITNLTVTIAS